MYCNSQGIKFVEELLHFLVKELGSARRVEGFFVNCEHFN